MGEGVAVGADTLQPSVAGSSSPLPIRHPDSSAVQVLSAAPIQAAHISTPLKFIQLQAAEPE